MFGIPDVLGVEQPHLTECVDEGVVVLEVLAPMLFVAGIVQPRIRVLVELFRGKGVRE
jgi:hypothetical protein